MAFRVQGHVSCSSFKVDSLMWKSKTHSMLANDGLTKCWNITTHYCSWICHHQSASRGETERLLHRRVSEEQARSLRCLRLQQRPGSPTVPWKCRLHPSADSGRGFAHGLPTRYTPKITVLMGKPMFGESWTPRSKVGHNQEAAPGDLFGCEEWGLLDVRRSSIPDSPTSQTSSIHGNFG